MTDNISREEFKGWTSHLSTDIKDIVLYIKNQDKINAENKHEIESFKSFKKNTVRVLMAMILSFSGATGIGAYKYAFEDDPKIVVKEGAKND